MTTTASDRPIALAIIMTTEADREIKLIADQQNVSPQDIVRRTFAQSLIQTVEAPPDKVRVEFSSATGTPLFGMSANQTEVGDKFDRVLLTVGVVGQENAEEIFEDFCQWLVPNRQGDCHACQ